MSGDDFLNGRMSANFANRRASAEADEAIGTWKEFSGRLQGKVQRAELAHAKAETGRIGFAHLVRALSDELRRVDPTNRLLNKDVQLHILGHKMMEKANEMGYRYDPATDSLSR